MNMADSNMEIQHKQTLLQMIKNAPGNRLFNSLFVSYKNSGEVKDVCNNGEYSCAFFTSSLLTINGYLERPHATVAGLRAKMLTFPFQKIELTDAQPGDVIFWDKIEHEDGTVTEHVGFVSEHGAVSTDFATHAVMEHPIEQPGGLNKPKRTIGLILRP